MMDRINRKLSELNDAICTAERAAGGEYTLVLIPHDAKKEVHVSINGKPTPSSFYAHALSEAHRCRDEGE